MKTSDAASNAVRVAFGRTLRELRRDADLSQERLAELADLDRTTPSLLERGLRQPTLVSILAIARCLQMDPRDLMGCFLEHMARLGWRADLSRSRPRARGIGVLAIVGPMLDPRYGNNFIDANVLNRRGDAEDVAVDEILRLRDEGAFTLLLPYSVKAEIEHPNTPDEVKRRAAPFIYSMPVELTQPELTTHEKIRVLVQGNARAGQHARDAFHLVESAKYGRHFITNDGRLLKKANDIWKLLLLRVLKPSEFLESVHQAKARGV